MKRWPHFKNSINSRLILWLVCLLTPLLFLLIFDNVYAIRVVRNQVTQSNMGTLDLYMDKVDSSLKDSERYLANMAIEIDDQFPMMQDESDTNLLRRQYELNNKLTSATRVYRILDAVFIYTPIDDNYIESAQDNYNFNERIAIREFLKEKVVDDDAAYKKEASSWYWKKIGNSFYLFRTFKVGGYFIGTFVNMDELIDPIKKSEFGRDKLLSFYEKDSALLTADSSIAGIDDGSGQAFPLYPDNKKRFCRFGQGNRTYRELSIYSGTAI